MRLDKEMDMLTKEQAKEERKSARNEKTREIVDSFGYFASDIYYNTFGKLRIFLEEKKENKEFQKESQETFDKYIDSHDPTLIGTIQTEELSNGGIKITIYTNKGPISKTIENAEDCQDKIEPKHICQDFYHKFYGRKITYEGYCSWEDFDTITPHYYYAKLSLVSKKNRDNSISNKFVGFERQNNGRFIKIDQVQSDYQPIEVYNDLCSRFSSLYYETMENTQSATK